IMKKLISIVLSVIMTLSVFTVAFSANSFAADVPEQTQSVATQALNEETLTSIFAKATELIDLKDIYIPTSWDDLGNVILKMLYGVVDVLIDVIVKSINSVIPSVKFEKEENYTNDMFFPGMSTWLSSPAVNAKWNLGYGSASLQTGNELDGNHFVGGSLSFPKTKAATEMFNDDQRVRVIAINDNSGRGTVVFASIDGFGLSNTDVRGIRQELKEFASQNNIVGINISVLHQHSCIDTFGMNGDLVKMIFKNPLVNIANNSLGTDFSLLNGQNKDFMKHLYDVTVDSIMTAVNTMTPGKLFYSATDVSKYIRDKRAPYVSDPDIHRFRFVPDNGGRETWLCNLAIHCVGNGAAGTAVTGDYPYYLEQYIDKTANANFIQIQGAELAISSNYASLNLPEDTDSETSIKAFGEALGQALVYSNEAETEVAPLLNYKMDEYNAPITNQILEFAGRLGALTNTVVEVKDEAYKLAVKTEIGYLEFGNKLAVAIIPGELEAAIAYGGYLDKTNSWKNKDFNYPSLQEIVGNDKELMVFGLTNDQIGYILEDNDYSSIISGVNEEIVATGNLTGSATINAFEKLYNSIEK
ncbi:MAG: hypothetical protein KBT46_08690, partial [Ruminococcus sp.]|nr:hypothetical protein [Candidatus Copronaster equi]